jgi:hypothetical protein
MQSEPLRGPSLAALFLAIGLIAFGYIWFALHQHHAVELSSSFSANRSHYAIEHWIHHGYFASHGLLFLTGDEKLVYRSGTGAYMISGFIAERIWIGLTGKYSWRLLALHNEVVALLTSTLLALLAYRIARRLGAGPRHAFVLGVAAQMAQFTFPDNLALYWDMTPQAFCLPAALSFLLLEERAIDEGRTRLLTALQALSVFALTYIEGIAATMFIVSYVAAVLLLRGERPPFKQLALMLLLPWALSFSVHGAQLLAARHEIRQTGGRFVGSSFLYRSGLDGDAMFYGDPLDIAFGRDVVRAERPGNRRYLFRWQWLFFAGAASLFISLVAYVRGQAPRFVIITLVALLGTYLLYAGVFSQAVALHPYLYDVLLATPLILALFGMAPALGESLMRRSGAFVVVAIFASAWLSLFQLRLYALCYPL